ncbi:MAG TPA: DNA polymerase ligase N-terminal domain-containing protein [Anaerovoracaceae bacterium]|nr:DNA polymerase ligase N-terminal domain-containing protein [Anaerovoracaceae bacterium]
MQKASWKRYVIQKHKAKNLHYDFRLEQEGVLKSWAVPKGLSNNPDEKRLAVEVDDHEFKHLTYESETVTIWDQGGYKNITGLKQGGEVISFREAYENGVIELKLKGEKLEGDWVLIRMDISDNKNNWLLKKEK